MLCRALPCDAVLCVACCAMLSLSYIPGIRNLTRYEAPGTTYSHKKRHLQVSSAHPTQKAQYSAILFFFFAQRSTAPSCAFPFPHIKISMHVHSFMRRPTCFSGAWLFLAFASRLYDSFFCLHHPLLFRSILPCDRAYRAVRLVYT